MALRMTRSRVASENAVPHKTVDGPAVPGLRPRTALGEIQNGRRAANPTRNVQRKKAVTVATVPLAETVKPVQVQPTVPERKALSPMETHGCESSNLCQAFSDVLLDIKDVDADDCDNSVLCSEYVKEIYKYMRHLETAQAIRPSFLQGQEVTGKMRALLVNWLAEVTMSFQLLKETMFMAVAVIDRFLQDQPVTKTKLQLVGVTALFLAAKYEEIHPPAIDDFVYVTDFTYTVAEIREMERRILTVLGFSLGRPLPIQFLRRASKIAEVTAEQHTVAKYLLELCMVDYDMAHLPPSQVASAALALVLKIFGCSDWDKTLSHYMDYTEEALLPVMQHIAGNVVTINEGQTKLTAIKKKYSSRRMMEIANIAQLKSAYIKNLAAVLKSQ